MKKVGLLAYGEMGYAALKSLISDFNVLWIIVPPKTTLAQSSEAVYELAKKNKVKVMPTNNNLEITDLAKKEIPDAIVISSYNKILPKELLELTKVINIHHGDLPKWRGRANINWAIILGRKKIGLTFHDAAKELDAGNIYKKIIIPIGPNDTVKSIYEAVNNAVFKNLKDVVLKVIAGYKGIPQHGEPSYCSTRLPEDGYIDWNKTNKEIHNLIRGVTKPYLGAFTYFKGKKLVIWSSELLKNARKYEAGVPGRIAQIHAGMGVEVLTADGTILIKDVNYNGKELNAAEVIKSTKDTLGITIPELYEMLQSLKVR